MKIIVKVKGGLGSGNWGHGGRKGQRGGSAPRSSYMPIKSSDWMERQEARSGEWNERERDAREDYREWDEGQDTKAYLNDFKKTLEIKNLPYVMKTMREAVEYAERANTTVADLEKVVDSQLEWLPLVTTNQQVAVSHITKELIPQPGDIIQVDDDYSNYQDVHASAEAYTKQIMEETGIPVTPLTKKIFIDTIPKRNELYTEPADNREVVMNWNENRSRTYEGLSEADKSAIRTVIAEKAYDIDIATYDMNLDSYPKVKGFIMSGKLRQAWEWAQENSGPQWDGKQLPGWDHQFAKALSILAKDGNLGWEASTLRY